MPADPRFIRLEEKLTFVEHQLGELDDVVRDLGDTLEQLGHRLDGLAGRVEQNAAALEGRVDGSVADPTGRPSDDDLRAERPPHW